MTLDAAKTVTANFLCCVTVSAATSGGTGATAKVDTAPNCPGGGSKFAPNSTVNISTSSTSVYDVFKEWSTTSGSLGAAGSPNTSLTLGTNNSTATATYETCKTLTTPVNPPGAGTISRSPAPNCGGDRYLPRTPVTLTANAGTGFVFDQLERRGDRGREPDDDHDGHGQDRTGELCRCVLHARRGDQSGRVGQRHGGRRLQLSNRGQ